MNIIKDRIGRLVVCLVFCKVLLVLMTWKFTNYDIIRYHEPELRMNHSIDRFVDAGIGFNLKLESIQGLSAAAIRPTTKHSFNNTTPRSFYGGVLYDQRPQRQSAVRRRKLQDKWFPRINERKIRPNVLFIVVDDLRPDLGIYHTLSTSHGSPWINQKMHTPNLDHLAAQSLLFTRAYAQIPWCNPSRTSFLTSRRPDTTMVHNNSVYFRQVNPNFVTLPQFFKNRGYFTAAAGKVFHRMKDHSDSRDDAHSWTISYNNRSNSVYEDIRNIMKVVGKDELKGTKLLDESTADQIIEILDELARVPDEARKPFFVAMGMKKPHLPFVFPERFLDHYPMDNISKPLNPKAPISMPNIAWLNSFEIRNRKECRPHLTNWTRNTPLPDDMLKQIRRGYYACVSYIDELIGRVLEKLETTGFSKSTIITFIGDHGFHLGEHGIVGKNTVFEVAANAPMMVSLPGITNHLMVTDRLVEFVDIYPTLVELAGFRKMPICPPHNSRAIDMCTEGTSVVPLLEEALGGSVKWKDSVFFQYPHNVEKGKQVCMGYSIRTAEYRYTEWTPYQYNSLEAADVLWNEPCGIELYDQQTDPHETNNIADDVAFWGIKEQLQAKLRAGWSQALPTST